MILLTISLGWKILLAITAISFIGVVGIFILGCIDADEPPDGTIFSYPLDELDEFSPEQLKTDQILKDLELKNKLNKIEEERGGIENIIKQQDDVDFDYERIDGK